MSLSAIGQAALEAREGNRRKAYRDSRGILTIGCGVTTASGLITVTPGLVLTAAECEALNAKGFARFGRYVDDALHGTWVEQHVYDALFSFCWNVGPGGFARSGALRYVKAGNMEAARQAMLLWRKPAEVLSRRQGEADQLVTPYSVRLPSARRGEAPVRAPVGRPAVAPSPVSAVPVLKPAPARPAPARPIPIRVPAHAAGPALPAWWLAIARFIDVMFGPPLRAH